MPATACLAVSRKQCRPWALAELQKLNALIETKGMPVELRAAIERVGRDLCAEASKELEV